MEYNFHIDPGHGWVEVSFKELVSLGIEQEISKYSYRKGDTCYLEEDCDYSKWRNAHNTQYGSVLKIKEVRYDRCGDPECFIRSLPRYHSKK
jgi:hypothetical protein